MKYILNLLIAMFLITTVGCMGSSVKEPESSDIANATGDEELDDDAEADEVADSIEIDEADSDEPVQEVAEEPTAEYAVDTGEEDVMTTDASADETAIADPEGDDFAAPEPSLGASSSGLGY